MSLTSCKANVRLAKKSAEERLAIANSNNIYDAGVKEVRWKILPNGAPDLDPKYTGKLFVEQDDGTLKEIEGAFFSNADGIVYDKDNNVHPAMKQYEGKKWSVQFKFNDQDKFGKTHTFENVLNSSLPWNKMGKLDWKGIIQAEQREAAFGIEHGAFDGYDDPFLPKFLTGAAVAFAGYMIPDKPLAECEVCSLFISWALLYDDFCDNQMVFGHQLRYAELIELRDRFREVLYGQKEPEDQTTTFDFPQCKPLCRMIKWVRMEVLKHAATYEHAQRFFKDWDDYMNSNVINDCWEWYEFKRKCTVGTHYRAFPDINRYDGGMLPTNTGQILAFYNKLDRGIYHTHFYEYFRKRVTDNIILVNDLFSHRKEMADGEKCNAVYVHHEEEGRDFIQSLKDIVAFINDACVDSVEIAKFLLYVHDYDKELEECIRLLLTSMQGQMLWYNYALRYHNGVIFHAIIHKDGWTWTLQEEEDEKVARLAKEGIKVTPYPF